MEKKYTIVKNKKLTATLSLLVLACSAALAQQDNENTRLFKRATAYFFQKKFEMAELLLQEVIKKDPENNLAYSYLGDILLKKKQFDGALNLYKKAIDIKPDNAENYFRVGQIYYYKKIGALAVENFTRAVELDPVMKFAYYHIGLTYLMVLRDKENTIKNWELFLQKAPEDPQYDSIRRVIELLKDPNFVLPPVGSEISIEEALHLGGSTLKKVDRAAEDRKAGHEDKKTKKKIEDIYLEEDMK